MIKDVLLTWYHSKSIKHTNSFNLTVAYEIGAVIIFIVLMGKQDTEVFRPLAQGDTATQGQSQGAGQGAVWFSECELFFFFF